MKTHKNNDQMKWILREGMLRIPSEDFNARVIEKFLSGQEKSVLKPSVNYTVLLFSAVLMLSFVGLILYIKGFSPYDVSYISNSGALAEKLYIALFALTSFSIFTIINDIIEDRYGFKKVF